MASLLPAMRIICVFGDERVFKCDFAEMSTQNRFPYKAFYKTRFPKVSSNFFTLTRFLREFHFSRLVFHDESQIIVTKGKTRADQSIKYHAHTPHVRRGSPVSLPTENLGTAVSVRSTKRLEERACVGIGGKAEIYRARSLL